MNKLECFTAFKIELDKVDSLQYPAFENEELEYYFDRAQEQLVKVRYGGNNPSNSSFEQNQKRTDDLRLLIIEDILTATTAGALYPKPNCYLVDLTELTGGDYMFLVGEECTISYTDYVSGLTVTDIKPVTSCNSNNYSVLVNNPLSPHILHYNDAKPLRLMVGNNVELITDGNYSVTNYIIKYIKYPTSFADLEDSDSPDFPTHVHSELVKLAVYNALENIESPRTQSYSNKITEME